MEILQNFSQTLVPMQWSDYVDIALVAFLIYKLLPLIRTPKIMRIVRTAALLVMAAWLTDELQLHTLSWILSQVLGIGLLAFVVLFQPELRQMLDHLGHVKLGNLFGNTRPVQEMERVIQQTVNACEKMAFSYTGALIVFARKDRLDSQIMTGTELDAQVSERLLRNIFFDKSPLHDKAVVIRNGRITAASCLMPLAESGGVLRDEMGTRHRAGLGISEATDAVAVVVSEETGHISLFVGGVPKYELTAADLAKHLRQELLPKNENRDSANSVGETLNRITKAGGKEMDHHGEK